MDAREANHFAKLKAEEQEAERKKLAAMSDEQRARYEKELADAKAHDEKKKRGVLKTKAAFSGGAGLVKTAGRGGRGGGGAGRGGRGRGGRGGGGSEGSATTRASDEAIGPNAGAEGESDAPTKTTAATVEEEEEEEEFDPVTKRATLELQMRQEVAKFLKEKQFVELVPEEDEVKEAPVEATDDDDDDDDDEWEAHFHEGEGKHYYHNPKTGETTWTKPGEAEEESDGDDEIRAEWQAHFDEIQGMHFYHNSTTGETTWSKPDGVDHPEEFEEEAEWEAHFDDGHGKHYYHNNRTGETTWSRPEGVEDFVAPAATTSPQEEEEKEEEEENEEEPPPAEEPPPPAAAPAPADENSKRKPQQLATQGRGLEELIAEQQASASVVSPQQLATQGRGLEELIAEQQASASVVSPLRAGEEKEEAPGKMRPSPTEKDLAYAQKTLVGMCSGTTHVTIDLVKKALGSDHELVQSDHAFTVLPFKFVHGTIAAIMEETGFGAGLFEEHEGNFETLRTTEWARREYFSRLNQLVWRTLDIHNNKKMRGMRRRTFGSIDSINASFNESDLFHHTLSTEEQIEVRRLIQYFAVAAVSVPSNNAAEVVRKVLKQAPKVDGDGPKGKAVQAPEEWAPNVSKCWGPCCCGAKREGTTRQQDNSKVANPTVDDVKTKQPGGSSS